MWKHTCDLCLYSLLICSPFLSIFNNSLSCTLRSSFLSCSNTQSSTCLINSSCSLQHTRRNTLKKPPKVLLIIVVCDLPCVEIKWNTAHKLMSRSSSCRACSSSNNSSPLAEEEEEELSECRWPSVPEPFVLRERTRLLQRWGWCRFRRDKTDWTLALTEWLQPTD